MGIDINMIVGVGIHIPKDVFERWLDDNDPDEEGGWEVLDRLLGKPEYRGLWFEWPGNAWIGEDNGWFIYASASTRHYNMGRSAEAGVYKPGKLNVRPEDREKLNAVSRLIVGTELEIEPLIGVSVS